MHDHESREHRAVDGVEQEQASWLQHAGDLVENTVDIGDVLQDVDADDADDAAVGERDRLTAADAIVDRKPFLDSMCLSGGTSSLAARFHGTCSTGYYRAAIDRLHCGQETLDLFMFSDDPRWVQCHAGLPDGYTMVDCKRRSEPAQDIWLMSLCRHHVIANNSLRWWGAWLGVAEGITVARARWFLDQDVAQQHIVPPRWARV